MTPIRGVRIAAALPFLIALVTAAPVAAARWVVPAASHAAGANGTTWRTDLELANTGATAGEATVTLLPANTDNSALSRSVQVSLPASGQVSLVDLLEAKFGHSGNAGLLVDSSLPLVVTSRTYNQAGSATFGQAIPGVPAEQAIVAGETGHIPYLAKSDRFRTNVGFTAVSAAAVTSVTVRVLDAAGALLGSKSFDLKGWGQSQVNDIFNAVGAPAAGVARAEITTTAPVVVYASIVDNTTGDPIAVLARHATEAYFTTLIPAISHADGAGDSHWRSDLRIVNASTAAASVTLSYYPINASTPEPVTKGYSVAAGQTLALDDAALSVFGQASGTGGVRVTSDRPVHVISRTFNDQASLGTYGQDIPGIPSQRTFTAGDVAIFPGLTDSGFRANLGFFNGGSTAVNLTLSLRSSAGAPIASKPYSVPAFGMAQLNNVLGFFGVSGVSSATLRVEMAPTASPAAGPADGGRGELAIYLSKVDSNSGDPTYTEMFLERSATGGGCRTLSLPSVGKTWTLSIDALTGGVRATGTLITTILESTATRNKSLAIQSTSAPGIGTINSTTTATSTYELLDAPAGYLSVSKVEQSSSVSGFSITSTTTFSPAWVTGPALDWCEGESWVRPAVTQSTTSNVAPSVTGPTATGNGQVLAVRESLTVPAGTFETVHYWMFYTGQGSQAGTSSEYWLDGNGLTVRQLEYDAAGALVATYERIPN